MLYPFRFLQTKRTKLKLQKETALSQASARGLPFLLLTLTPPSTSKVILKDFHFSSLHSYDWAFEIYL
jgi:hypothetical protein